MSARRFRLDIVGELEDRPRLLRAYGKVRGAELAVVLRPTEHRGLFVVLGKEACTAWSADLAPSETRVRGRLVIGAKTEVQVDGSAHRVAGTVPAGLADGTLVEVAVDAASGRARVLVGGDAPRLGTTQLELADAVAQVKAMQRGLPPKGPTTLRGRWTGAFLWDGVPAIELKRKLAAYGTLTVRSGTDGWSWTFERSGRWYGEEKRQEGVGPTLMDAIETGITAAMLLVREACGFRDTRRRAAVDADWASTHPIAEPKERANPTERLGAKGGCACKKKAAVPGTVGPPEEPVVSDDPLIGHRYDRMPRERGESVYTYARRLVTEASARAGEGHHRVARELLDEAGRVAAGLSGSKAARVHEHVDHVRGKLEGARRPVANAKKDEALIGVFRDAVRSALAVS